MNHLGDICKINGAEIELVDVIVGGSPCQDLSVAGKRNGLDGARSGLFMEQIRIVREQRNESIKRSDNPIRPRWMVWENVPGAFSSNKAEDFRIVLEETARVADSNAVIPRPPKNKWSTAGCVMGDGWSIAWRVQDAQFWGVPQRRRRIALVADFGGHTAPEILFERKGVPGDIEASGAEREGVARNAEGGVGAASCYPINTQIITRHQALGRGTGFGMGEDGEPAYTLQAGHEHGVITYSIGCFNSEGMLSPNPHAGIYEADTSRTLDLNGGNPACNQGGIAVVESAGFCPEESAKTRGIGYAEEQSPSLRAGVTPAIVMAHGQANEIICFEPRSQDGVPRIHESGVCPTLNTAQGGQRQPCVANNVFAVRRLTPLECSRLQGYPDNWAHIPEIEPTEQNISFFQNVWNEWADINGEKHKTRNALLKWMRDPSSDSAEYKSYGNSIALPPWRFVLSRIYQHGARTMGSLFDGIGGFPLIFNELGGRTLWASEIEPFPIAVTMVRFNAKGGE